MATHKISDEIAVILRRARIEGSILRIDEKLQPKVYAQVRKVLDNCGGTWNRGLQGHLFGPTGIPDLMRSLDTGKSVDPISEHQAFYTPELIARDMAQLALMRTRTPARGQPLRMLEPSVGGAALVHAAMRIEPTIAVVAVEIRAETCLTMPSALRSNAGFTLKQADFLTLEKKDLGDFDLVLMNPPFAKGQDLEHIRHAAGFLRPGGTLCALAWPAFMQPGTRKQREFSDWLQELEADVERLPESQFGRTSLSVARILFTTPKVPSYRSAMEALKDL